MLFANWLALLAKYIVNALDKWDSKHLHYDSLRAMIGLAMCSIAASFIPNVVIVVILNLKHMNLKCPLAPSLMRPGHTVAFN